MCYHNRRADYFDLVREDYSQHHNIQCRRYRQRIVHYIRKERDYWGGLEIWDDESVNEVCGLCDRVVMMEDYGGAFLRWY
jgi:hypothetical protein